MGNSCCNLLLIFMSVGVVVFTQLPLASTVEVDTNNNKNASRVIFESATKVSEEEGSQEVVERVLVNNNNNDNNKKTKILTGQSRPPPPPPQNQYNNYNNYNNGYPNVDLTGQNSNPKPSYQHQPYPSTGLHPPAPLEGTNSSPPQNNIPEVYIQLIGAIEKLVSRVDSLDTRLKTLEKVVLHLTNSKEQAQPDQGSCPENFIKIDSINGKCFYLSSKSKPVNLYDWKSGHAECGKLGGRLAEMHDYDQFLRVSHFLAKYSGYNRASSDYWVGGINPGLIWIWSESGQQVGMDKRFWNENDNNSGAAGCLKMSYSHRLKAFFFKSAPCMHSQNILCEVLDNSVARALARFEKHLLLDEKVDEMVNEE